MEKIITISFLLLFPSLLQCQSSQMGLDPEGHYQVCVTECDAQNHFHQHCKDPRPYPPGVAEELGLDQKNDNPYFIGEGSFDESIREEGSTKVFQRFSEHSSLLRKIDDYRLTWAQLKPNTFFTPVHFDAEVVFFIIRGRGIVNFVLQERNESHFIDGGDVIRVLAGTMISFVNRDSQEKLEITKFMKSVAVPGQYHPYHGMGGVDSYYPAFSDEVLQAAFNAPKNKLERLFRKDETGVMRKASREQIKAFSEQASRPAPTTSPWVPYKLLRKPKYSSNLGKQYRVNPTEYQQLQDLGLSVSFTDITKGAMTAPFYSLRETAIILVVGGRGRFEIVSPYLSKGRGKQVYQRVSSHLSPETVFVIPPGHPAVIIASDNENLQLVTFDVNGGDVPRAYLAGKNNILNQLQKEAKELSFNMEAEEVESIANNQENAFFLPGPK